ncbi:MAG: hypothetical protein ACOYL2_05665 [Burkholderiaceae bacterium]|jgi:hypothetical protein
MAQQINTILLLLILIGIVGALLVMFFTLEKVDDIQTGKSAQKPRFNPADTFGGLSGRELWDAMIGVPMRGINPKELIPLKPRYEVVLQKHLEILFEEGQHDGREGFSMPVRCERIVPTLRGDIESWIPHEFAVGIYKVGYSLITEPDEDPDTLREKLDEIGDEIFSATGLPPHPLSKLLMPFKEEEEFPPEEPEDFEIAEEPTEEVMAEGEGENNPEAVAALPAPEEATAAELAQGDAAATDSENTAQGSSELDELQAAAEAMAAERLASENPTAKPEPVPTA